MYKSIISINKIDICKNRYLIQNVELFLYLRPVKTCFFFMFKLKCSIGCVIYKVSWYLRNIGAFRFILKSFIEKLEKIYQYNLIIDNIWTNEMYEKNKIYTLLFL